MRVNPLDVIERASGQCQEMVHNRYFELPDNRDLVLEQQVEVAMDAAADRVFDRQHAVVDGATVDRGKHVLEASTGHQDGVTGDLPRGGFAERSGFSLVGNAHVNGS